MFHFISGALIRPPLIILAQEHSAGNSRLEVRCWYSNGKYWTENQDPDSTQGSKNVLYVLIKTERQERRETEKVYAKYRIAKNVRSERRIDYKQKKENTEQKIESLN